MKFVLFAVLSMSVMASDIVLGKPNPHVSKPHLRNNVSETDAPVCGVPISTFTQEDPNDNECYEMNADKIACAHTCGGLRSLIQVIVDAWAADIQYENCTSANWDLVLQQNISADLSEVQGSTLGVDMTCTVDGAYIDASNVSDIVSQTMPGNVEAPGNDEAPDDEGPIEPVMVVAACIGSIALVVLAASIYEGRGRNARGRDDKEAPDETLLSKIFF